MDENYKRDITLTKPKTGQEIIDMMKEMVKGGGRLNFESETHPWNYLALRVGFSGPHPYDHVVVLTGKCLDEEKLEPSATYKTLAVGNTRWPGEVYPGGYHGETLRMFINVLADNLESRL